MIAGTTVKIAVIPVAGSHGNLTTKKATLACQTALRWLRPARSAKEKKERLTLDGRDQLDSQRWGIYHVVRQGSTCGRRYAVYG